MNIIFFTDKNEDYLSDSMLHGFRQLYGNSVIDFPKKNCMYKSYSTEKKVYGNGFTLYRTMDEIDVDRTNIEEKLKKNYFDLIVISDIQRQHNIYNKYLEYLTPRNTIILDGEDNESVFPFKTIFYKKYFKIKKPHKYFLYFKRELTTRSIKSLCYNLLPTKICAWINKKYNIHPISFSIPKEKIIEQPATSSKKLFPSHIVDKEISNNINSTTAYAFTKEHEYYQDLQSSRFGITMKRGGWDCLRHYEIAANGAVICFKDIDKKPETCAPHGLNESNCISYSNYDDLMNKLDRLPDDTYIKLQENSIKWACKNTTIACAERVLLIFNKYRNGYD